MTLLFNPAKSPVVSIYFWESGWLGYWISKFWTVLSQNIGDILFFCKILFYILYFLEFCYFLMPRLGYLIVTGKFWQPQWQSCQQVLSHSVESSIADKCEVVLSFYYKVIQMTTTNEIQTQTLANVSYFQLKCVSHLYTYERYFFRTLHAWSPIGFLNWSDSIVLCISFNTENSTTTRNSVLPIISYQ